jgi:general secretion pathway protein I
MSAKNSRGFTLLEVMVALAIVAISLMAGMKAMGSLINATVHLQQNFLGSLCAQNALNSAVLNGGASSESGSQTQNCTQAGRTLQVLLTTSKVPNKDFILLSAQSSQDNQSIVSITTAMNTQ